DTSFDLAEQRMQRVSEVLTLNDTTVGDFHFNYCRPKTRPNAYPMSAGNLIELAAEYSVCGYEIKGE
ncbi:phage tail terminator protein, partial [Acinetobacter baumannii]